MMIEATGSAGGIEILWDPGRLILEYWIDTKFTLSDLGILDRVPRLDPSFHAFNEIIEDLHIVDVIPRHRRHN